MLGTLLAQKVTHLLRYMFFMVRKCKKKQIQKMHYTNYNYYTEYVTILYTNNVMYKIVYKINTIIMTIIQNPWGTNVHLLCIYDNTIAIFLNMHVHCTESFSMIEWQLRIIQQGGYPCVQEATTHSSSHKNKITKKLSYVRPIWCRCEGDP